MKVYRISTSHLFTRLVVLGPYFLMKRNKYFGWEPSEANEKRPNKLNKSKAICIRRGLNFFEAVYSATTITYSFGTRIFFFFFFVFYETYGWNLCFLEGQLTRLSWSMISFFLKKKTRGVSGTLPLPNDISNSSTKTPHFGRFVYRTDWKWWHIYWFTQFI